MIATSRWGLLLAASALLTPASARAQSPAASRHQGRATRPASDLPPRSGGGNISCARECWATVVATGQNRTLTEGKKAEETQPATGFRIQLLGDRTPVLTISASTGAAAAAGRYVIQPTCPAVTHRQIPGALMALYTPPAGNTPYARDGVLILEKADSSRVRGHFDIGLCYSDGTTARLTGHFVARVPS